MKRYLITVVMLVAAGFIYGQNFKDADEAFAKKSYAVAVEKYLANIDKFQGEPQELADVKYRLGESYHKMNDLKNAKQWYMDAINDGCEDPECYYQYGLVQQKLGSYTEALNAFKAYKDLKPSDERVDAKIESCKFAINKGMSNKLVRLRSQDPVNSNGSEYGVGFYQDFVYFTSAETSEDNQSGYIDSRSGLLYSDIYRAKIDNQMLVSPKRVRKLSKNKVNSANFTYDATTETAYFTRCMSKDLTNCYIYSAQRKGKKSWKKIQKVDLGVASCAHPSVTADGQRLYFTSNQGGGYGGNDIWFVNKRADSTWSAPVNAGPNVNSAGDEVFPFAYGNEVLYFSSDGLVGFGGLDVFSSRYEDGLFTPAVNLGMPINSSADDFSYATNGTLAYMATNRADMNNNDDIYSVEGDVFMVDYSGKVTDEMTGDAISDVTIEVRDSNGNLIDKKKTSGNGAFNFYLKPEETYTISYLHPDYVTVDKPVSTEGVPQGVVSMNNESGYDVDVKMLTHRDAEEMARKAQAERERKAKLQALMNQNFEKIYFEYNKADLDEEAFKCLDNVYAMMTENPEAVIEIDAYADERGRQQYNLELSTRRAEACRNYLQKKGIDKNRLTVKGHGSSDPVVKNAQTEADHRQNRRAAISVIGLLGE